MDTFRKWWNKPKADDQSLLARFYFADESLTAVATELDSFDGRAEPERCSRLVARLRQGQDQVLSITNVIMDELLADDRTPRAFRAKFPEEVLQESLAGQLWFGAECLAAGSSIMNREFESAAMRPLAKAVTKSLDNVRNLLREQCLRIKQPNAARLQLDTNDAFTETLCESLKIFDRLFAEFELLYVSAMVQVKTIQEHESQEMICVLFSETLQRALRMGRLNQDQVDYFDPALMFSIPRLAIVAGLVIFPRGPLNMSHGAENLSEMFRPFRTLLVKIRDLLRTLTAAELNQLEQLLCTSEEIGGGQQTGGGLEAAATTATTTSTALEAIPTTANSSQQQQTTTTATTMTTTIATSNSNSNCDDNDDETPAASSNLNLDGNSDQQLVISKHVITDESTNYDNNTTTANNHTTHFNVNSTSTLADVDVNLTAWHSEAVGDTRPLTESGSMHASITSAEGASGYFLSNTNLGQLLQPVETPLTDRFGPVSDDDNQEDDDDNCGPMNAHGSSSAGGVGLAAASPPPDSGLGSTAENTSLDRSPESEVSALQMPPTQQSQSTSNRSSSNHTESSTLGRKYSANWERLKATSNGRQQLEQRDAQQPQRRRHSMSTADPQRYRTNTNTTSSRRFHGQPRPPQQLHFRGGGAASLRVAESTDNASGRSVSVSVSGFDKHSSRRAIASAARAAARAAAKAESVAAAAAATASRLSSSPSSSASSSSSSSSSYMSASATSSPTSSAATRSLSLMIEASASATETPTERQQAAAADAASAADAGGSKQATASVNSTVHSTRKKRSSAAKYSPDSSSGEDDTSSSSSSLSDSGETRAVQKQLAVRAAGRMKFKSTENLLHRLFVCIAGVADQLQTNFASDLRQILRSVFLMNMSPATDDDDDDGTIKTAPRPKDADGPAAADLFEFRASEQDVVIQRDEREGSNQSIYSAAEEANAEDSSGADSVFGADAEAEAANGSGNRQHHRQERSASFEAAAHHRQALLRQAAAAAVAGAAAGTVTATTARTRSLGEESSATDSDEGGNGGDGGRTTAIVGGRPYTPENELRRSATQAVRVPVPVAGSRGSGASSLAGSHGSTGAGSPHNPHRTQTMAAMAAAAAAAAVASASAAATATSATSTPSVQPPRWIPDEEAPRCMACAQSFTTFRRRHHCRNCGGVFCGVCSAASAPLPKFGLIKAVRVCRDCFVHEVGA